MAFLWIGFFIFISSVERLNVNAYGSGYWSPKKAEGFGYNTMGKTKPNGGSAGASNYWSPGTSGGYGFNTKQKTKPIDYSDYWSPYIPGFRYNTIETTTTADDSAGVSGKESTEFSKGLELTTTDSSAGVSDEGSKEISEGLECDPIEVTLPIDHSVEAKAILSGAIIYDALEVEPIALDVRREGDCNDTYCNDFCAKANPLAWSGFCSDSNWIIGKTWDYWSCKCDFLKDCYKIVDAECEKQCERGWKNKLEKICKVPLKNITCACQILSGYVYTPR